MEPFAARALSWLGRRNVGCSELPYMPNVGQLKNCPSRSQAQEIIKQQKWFKEALEKQDFRASAS
jgi:hypothetical protein